MSLEPINDLIRRAVDGRYALGYFESWNLESTEGVIDAAEETQSPILIGFNGEFLSHSKRCATERLSLWAAMAKEAANSATVPCGLVFNECPDIAWVKESMALGFNLILPLEESGSYESYLRLVKELVPYAHQREVAVEAELGELPCGASGTVQDNGSMTDPVIAGQFVRDTGVDLLAISVGNVHIQVHDAGSRGLDLERIAAIRQEVDIPLVLHGGTGIPADSLREAIRLGVAKVNYGTYLKQRYLSAVREAMASERSNPHELLGLGGAPDIMVTGRRAVRDAVLERIEVLGCCGKAWQPRAKVPPPSRQFDKGLIERTH